MMYRCRKKCCSVLSAGNPRLSGASAFAFYGIVLLAAAAMFGCSNPSGSEGSSAVFPGALPIERVSLGADGIEGNNNIYSLNLSRNGRYVVFSTYATNLVPGDTNGYLDVFFYDRYTSEFERVSRAYDGGEPNNQSSLPSVSADGRFVLYQSTASNIVENDSNGGYDIFLFDRSTGITELVSVNSDGDQANDGAYFPSMSDDARYIVCQSIATNLVPEDTSADHDIYVFDRDTGEVVQGSVSSGGAQTSESCVAPDISSDGSCVVFRSSATDLVSGDTNGNHDIFLRDISAGTTELISTSSTGVQGNAYNSNASVSGDGRYVVFESASTNLVPGDTNGFTDVFLKDRQNGTIRLVSLDSEGGSSDGASYGASISQDGRYVSFLSNATELIEDDTNGFGDIFVSDMTEGTMQRVSLAYDGSESNLHSENPDISGDGRYTAFMSRATNLVPSDTNRCTDSFVAPVL